MRIPRFFHGEPLEDVSGSVRLDEDEARHVARVLRLEPGAPIRLFDGLGFEGRAVVATVRKSEVVVNVESVAAVSREPVIRITACIALPRGGAADDVMQKAIEAGASRVVPLVTRRSVHRPDRQNEARRRERFHKLAIATLKQCGRNLIPTLSSPADIAELELPGDGLFGCTAAGSLPLRDHEASLGGFAGEVSVVVGPEGGLDEDEHEALQARGFHPVSLTPQVMRVETAVVALVSALASLREHHLRP